MAINSKNIAALFEFTVQGVNKWKRENRKIISLLELYCDDKDIEEFLETGKISKLENITTSKNELDLIQKLIVDNAKYSVKLKYLQLFSSVPDIETEILSKVINSINDDDYNINNSKEILLERIKGFVVNIKEKRVSRYHVEKLIEGYFSNLEIYAMLKLKNDLWDNEPIK